MKAIIVGGGIMGLSTAWGLARDGHEVELFEQGPLPNPLASSMDEHRLIRHPYGDHVGYARLIDDAFTAWDLLWGDLPLAELRLRFPQIEAKGVERAFWMDSGGVLFAQDIVTALAEYLARQPRIRLHPHTTVRSVDLEQGRIVTEAGTSHAADIVVVAAGAWVDRLLPDLGRRLIPSRQVVIYFDLPEQDRAAWAKGPMIIEKTGDVGLYLVPPMEGRGFKVGDHEFSRSGDPTAERTATEDDIRPLLQRCRSLLRGFDRWRTDRLKVCFYTVTEDERFLVEKRAARGWVMSPCSGHGFKFGALMGLELARTIASGRDASTHARWAAGLEATAAT